MLYISSTVELFGSLANFFGMEKSNFTNVTCHKRSNSRILILLKSEYSFEIRIQNDDKVTDLCLILNDLSHIR